MLKHSLISNRINTSVNNYTPYIKYFHLFHIPVTQEWDVFTRNCYLPWFPVLWKANTREKARQIFPWVNLACNLTHAVHYVFSLSKDLPLRSQLQKATYIILQMEQKKPKTSLGRRWRQLGPSGMLLRKKKPRKNSKLKFNLSHVYAVGAGNGSAQNTVLSITRLHIISEEVKWKQR